MISEINTFGTSFTKGGGFEFWENSKLYEFYTDEKYNIPKTQFSFSWPGQLQKIFEDNNLKIKVNNFAKSGYGHELLIRKAFDIISSNIYRLPTQLFIFEFGAMGRKEYYHNELGYIITNYHFQTDKEDLTFVVDDTVTSEKTITHGIAKTWFEDSEKIINKLDNELEQFNNFNELTINFKTELEKMGRDIINFLAFCDKLNVNYMISSAPFIPPKYHHLFPIRNSKKIIYQKTDDIASFISNNKLRIVDETGGLINDNHAGYHGNNLIANIIYNKIIKENTLI